MWIGIPILTGNAVTISETLLNRVIYQFGLGLVVLDVQ